MATATIDLLETIQLIPGYDPVATAGDCFFDEDAARLAADFFPDCLKHVKGEKAGQPFELEPWEAGIIANVFGWKRPDGTRRYRTVFIFVPRKNGKTSLTGGATCYMLFVDKEPGAELYSAAADAKQARLVWDQVVGMIRQEPEMVRRCRIYKGYKSIELRDLRAVYRVISHDAGTKYGFNTQFATVDELHAQPNRDLVDALETSIGSRREPLLWYITTSDWDRESICNEKLKYAEKVRDGGIEDPSFLPAIWAADRDCDWQDPDVWRAANPNLGVSLSLDYLERECQRAVEVPAYENTFKRLHLNIKTGQSTRIIPMAEWDACAGAVDPEALKGQRCYAGLDLSSTMDTTALALLFPDAGNAVLPFFWVPGDNARERERRDRVPYITWARQGYVELTPGNVVDYAYIRRRLNELSKDYDIQETAYDPWNATQLALQLQDEDGFRMVEYRQGWKTMNEPMKYTLALIRKGDMRHGGHPVLREQAKNLAAKIDASENMRPDKKGSSERIDGMVAVFMAIGLTIKQTKTTSVYDERGILTV